MAYDELFGKVKGGKKSRDLNIDLSSGKVKEAHRASQKLPQAILKISSYSRGGDRALAHGLYISRNGNEELEDPQGNILKNPKELKARLAEWEGDFDKRKNSRDTVNIILSAPKGSDPGQVENAVREFAKKNFEKNNDYLFAIHTDTDHPHGHLMVKMRGHDGEKLNLGKKELRDMRQSFSEILRENGVEVDATPRLARGNGQRGKSIAIKKMEERKVSPYIKIDGEKVDIQKAAYKDVIKDKNRGEKQSEKPWAKAARAKTEKYKEEYKEIGEALIAASKVSPEHSKGFLKMGTDILTHANSIPVPKSKREVIEDQLTKVASNNKSKDNDISR